MCIGMRTDMHQVKTRKTKRVGCRMTILSVAIRVLVFLIVAGAALLYYFQSKLLFYPAKLEKNFAFSFSLPHEEKFISYNKETLHGLLFKANKPKARMMYFHGNRGALDKWGQVGADLSEKLNCDIFILDHPGFGKSTGSLPTSEKELYESADAAFAEFIASTDKTLPIILYGRSLGSALASYLASKNKVQALILETPYLSIKAMAKVLFPFVPSFFVHYDLDNAKNIQGLNIPILILHGTGDTVVPYIQGKELAALNSNAEFITIDDGNHNTLANYPLYWNAVENFVAKISL
ncbi:alpha/beta hydrolase [Bdellovibrio sp. qaytius]|nr:alpha/beta hydrolase [Bdellovibrio sp. qaytius]